MRRLLLLLLSPLLVSCAVSHRADEVMICFGLCMKVKAYEQIVNPEDAAFDVLKRP